MVQQGSVPLGSIGRAGSSFLNRLYWFGVVVLYTWGQFVGQGLSISQQVILVWCSRVLHLVSITWVGPPHFSIGCTGLLWQVNVHLGSISRAESSFLNRLYWFGVVGLYIWGQLPGKGLLISQQVILVCCSRILYTWVQLAGEGLLISQQVILVWCSMALYIWGQLVREGLPISQQVILLLCSMVLYTCP